MDFRGHLGSVVAAAVLVAVPSAVEAAPEPGQAGVIADPRVNEASSLTVSAEHPGIAYTANDEHQPVVFAVDIATGAVVGTTRLAKGKRRKVWLGDPEAMSRDSAGNLWLADTGDNNEVRHDAALYAFQELGGGRHRARATRYPIAYGDGRPHNVETLLINPTTGAKYLVSKVYSGTATVYALPETLSTTSRNVALPIATGLPQILTDGSFTPDGSAAVVRDYHQAYVLDPATWTVQRTVALPPMKQGEGLSFDPSDAAMLLDSEGRPSPLIWVDF